MLITAAMPLPNIRKPDQFGHTEQPLPIHAVSKFTFFYFVSDIAAKTRVEPCCFFPTFFLLVSFIFLVLILHWCSVNFIFPVMLTNGDGWIHFFFHGVLFSVCACRTRYWKVPIYMMCESQVNIEYTNID